MRAPMLILALATSVVTGGIARAEEGCAVCHGTEAQQFERSVHASAKISCVSCHGGDPAPLDKDEAHAGEVLSLTDHRAGVESCASCHSDLEQMRGFGLRTDQASLYWTSNHGQRLAEDDDPNTATCMSCHGAHDILRAEDPRSSVNRFNQPETCGRCHADTGLLEQYGHETDVVGAYRRSVHGKALLERGLPSSPACSDCHGSHGATPPGVDEVGRVCGNCHSVVQTYFEASPHLSAAREGVMEECVSCHGSHGVENPSAEMLVGRGPGHCATCHLDEDEPARRLGVQLYNELSAFDESVVEAERAVREAGAMGLFVAGENVYLDDARSLRSRTRSAAHSLSGERLTDLIARGEGMVAQTYASLDIKQRALRDRKILTAIFFGVTLLLAGVLQTYRKEVLQGRKGSLRRARRRRAEA